MERNSNLYQPSSNGVNKYENKITNALNELAVKFICFMQTIMIGAEIEAVERRVYSATFIRLMLLSLIQVGRKLQQLKKDLSLSLNHDESLYIERLLAENNSFNINPKIAHAMQLFKVSFPESIENIMIEAEFTAKESSQDHHIYVMFFSVAFKSLVEMFFRYNERSKSIPKSLRTNFDLSPNLMLNSYPKGKFDLAQGTGPCVQSASSINLLASTKSFLTYCISSPSSKVVLKVTKSEESSIKDIEKLDNELKVSNCIIHPSLRSAIIRTTYQHKEALLLEWVDGCPLSEASKFSVGQFIVIAREIVSTILAMHSKGFMHLNLSCRNIILGKNNAVKIIGLCRSCSFNNVPDYVSFQDLDYEDLFYISPELTGRVNRLVDFRSDFYSLGIVFYKLLTGNYPFESKDALKLVHKHILNVPKNVQEVNPSIPKPISDMVSKLLKKNAYERYNSAKGIIHDLDWMRTEFKSDPSLKVVELALHDQPETLMIPEILYGRSAVYNELCSSFDRLDPDTFEVMFVRGKSGTGKSTVTKEFHQHVIQKNGIFLCGKFDKSKDEPCSALLDAVRGFCDDLLLENKNIQEKFKSRIQTAVCDEGKILTDLISNLQSIIGEQPPISSGFGKEAKNRFNYVLQNFFKAICSTESPIILLLEDLHWCDLGSSDFLNNLVQDKSLGNFMFIGTYRENEVDCNHPVVSLIEYAKGGATNLNQVHLDNLDIETLNMLISDTLSLPHIESYPLTAAVYKKTKGNCFFVHQMLTSLYDQGLLFFCKDTMTWKWKLCEIGLSENVLDLLCEKIISLDKSIQQALKVASCLGSPFYLPALKLVLNERSFDGVLSTGMITQHNRSETMYRFSHDQIQQAAYSLLPRDPRHVLLYIANKLWRLLSKEELYENIFVLANLLYKGVDIVEEQEKRVEVAHLLMQAGDKAMTATAFQQALKYYAKSVSLLGDQCWEKNYDFCLKVFDCASKAAYSGANYSSMNQYINEISENASCTQHLVQSQCLNIRYHNDLRLFENAIHIGNDILNRIDEKINLDHDNESLVYGEIQKSKNLLSGLSDKQILELGDMNDEASLSLMMIFTELLYSSFFIRPRLYSLLTSRMIQLTFAHGISKFASYAFSSFGNILRVEGDESGYQFGKVSLKLLHKAKEKELIPKVYNAFYHLIGPFYEPIHNMFEPILKSYKIALEVGDDTSYSGHVYCAFSFLSGRHLPTLIEEIDEFKTVLRSQALIPAFLSIQQAVLNLLGKNRNNPSLLQGVVFDYNVLFKEEIKDHEKARPLIFCGLMSYLFNDYASSVTFFQECQSIECYLVNTTIYPFFLFYEGLAYLALANSVETKDELVTRVKENIVKLRMYSEKAPENYMNKVCLLEAEYSLVTKDNIEAEVWYRRAISFSMKNGFVNEQAIAAERFGIFNVGFDKASASQFLIKAFHCYQQWGAEMKLKHLVNSYPQVFTDDEFHSLQLKLPLNMQIESESMSSFSQVTSEISQNSLDMNCNKRLRMTFDFLASS